jgi:replicative DNA helicase
LTNTVGNRQALEWDALFAEFSKPQLCVEKEQLPGWSPATFKGDRRKKEACDTVSAIVLDYDEGNLDSAALVWGTVYGFIHTTPSHSPEHHRFRVILPLSRAVSPAEQQQLFSWARGIANDAGHTIDETTKDPSRFWFVPGVKSGAPFETRELKGDHINVDGLLRELEKPQLLPLSKPVRVQVPKPSREARYSNAALERASNAIRTAPDGQRNDTLNKQAHAIGGLVASGHIDANEATNVLWSAALEAGLPETEAAKTLNSGFASGEKRPRQIPDGIERTTARRPANESAPTSDALPPPPPLRSPAERARELGSNGVHLLSGFKTFDEATRGGPTSSCFVVVGGAPGAGKTTWLCNMAMKYSEAGSYVAVLASDEGPDGLLIRIGQNLGFERDKLEAGDPETKEEFAHRLETELPMLIIADADDGHTVESVAAHLLEQAEGRHAVLIVDSIQTVRAMGSAEAESMRLRVDAVVSALKNAARSGLLVFASCELNRGSYRSRDAADSVADLAAFKESGGIEYGAQVAMLLRNVPDSSDLVDVAMAKNRLGRKMDFRLQLDYGRAEFREVPKPEEPPADEKREMKAQRKFEGYRERVLETVRKHPELKSKRQIIVKIGAGNQNLKLDAINSLIDDGSIVVVNDVFRVAPDTEVDRE